MVEYHIAYEVPTATNHTVVHVFICNLENLFSTLRTISRCYSIIAITVVEKTDDGYTVIDTATITE